MLLLNKFEIRFCNRALTKRNFPNCGNVVDYLAQNGINNAVDIQGKEHLLKMDKSNHLEINLFLAYFIFENPPKCTKRQLFLVELLIHLFFPDGLDLMKSKEVNKFYELAAAYFPTCFPVCHRKTLGVVIRKNKNLISYKQGGYLLIEDVKKQWDIQELLEVERKIEFELENTHELDPKYVFDQNHEALKKSKIYNSHYMFSVLREISKSSKIEYYRNTFVSKIRRKR